MTSLPEWYKEKLYQDKKHKELVEVHKELLESAAELIVMLRANGHKDNPCDADTGKPVPGAIGCIERCANAIIAAREADVK